MFRGDSAILVPRRGRPRGIGVRVVRGLCNQPGNSHCRCTFWIPAGIPRVGIEVFPVLAEYHHKKAEIKRLTLLGI